MTTPRRALVVIDVQNDYFDGPLEIQFPPRDQSLAQLAIAWILRLDVMTSVDPKKPGVNPQPWVGIQYVSIPEFQDVGNQCAQLIADYIANRKARA